MKIGVVGLGVVGSANVHGFKKLGHEVFGHDIKTDSKISDLVSADIIFICVPTPPDDRGSCDLSIVRSVLVDLSDLGYLGICCVRSTVPPGSTQKFQHEYPALKICFSPEFLRERSAEEDFVDHQSLLLVGTTAGWIYEAIVKAHGHLPKDTLQCKPSEAELIKYYKNVFAAVKVTFANMMYELAGELSSDYEVLRSSFCVISGESPDYLYVNENLRGFAGPCLPKDCLALAQIINEHNLPFALVDSVIKDNSQIPTTVLPGMRSV